MRLFFGRDHEEGVKIHENSAEYIVKTRWGTFSLDERAYCDYLRGRLWICWDPTKPAQTDATVSEGLPPNVGEGALSLRSKADRLGILPVLWDMGVLEAAVPYSKRLNELSIDEINLTVRSSNGLKRANAGTFGKLYELLSRENGIMSVRNLGQKSAREIKQQFFEECYTRLSPYEKAVYWQELLDKQQV